jgi:ribosome-binding factor A
MSAGHHRRRRDASADVNGIDPSEFFEPHQHARVQRKVQQLCKEVERTLGYALPACDDPMIHDLVIVSVEPAPDASRLLVTLAPSSSLEVDVGVLIERVQRVRGWLRGEIAAAIQRKRTPELAFQIVPARATEEDEQDEQAEEKER